MEEEKGLPLLEVKEEVQSFFDLRKDSENLTVKKKVKRVIFYEGGRYKGYESSFVASYDTEYLKRVLKMS